MAPSSLDYVLHNYPDHGDAMCRGKYLQPSPSSTWPRTITSRHHSALHCIFHLRNNLAIDTTRSRIEPFTRVLELAKLLSLSRCSISYIMRMLQHGLWYQLLIYLLS